VLATVIATAGASAGIGGDAKRPRSMALASGGESVRSAQGSWCYTGRRQAMCVDYAYPLRIKQRLGVSPGETVTLRTHDPSIAKLSASLLRVRGHRVHERGSLEDVERVDSNPRAWRATIPEGATDANVIDVFVRYKRNRGDSNWWAGVRLGN
jgi:hypothetical protein